MQSRNRRCKTRERNAKLLVKELPYFDLKGNLPLYHGQFNNSFQSELPTNRSLERLNGFYDLDLFKLNTNLIITYSVKKFIVAASLHIISKNTAIV